MGYIHTDCLTNGGTQLTLTTQSQLSLIVHDIILVNKNELLPSCIVISYD